MAKGHNDWGEHATGILALSPSIAAKGNARPCCKGQATLAFESNAGAALLHPGNLKLCSAVEMGGQKKCLSLERVHHVLAPELESLWKE